MRGRVLPALVTAGGVGVLTFSSVAASSVLGVVTSMGRYPESMMDYVLPVLGSAAENWILPAVVFALAAWAGLLVLSRGGVSVPFVVLGGVLVSVVAALIVGAAVAIGVVLDGDQELRLRELSEQLFSAAHTTGVVFLVGTPILVLGAVLLRHWQGDRGLTEPANAL